MSLDMFDPKLIVAWGRGAKAPVRITLETKALSTKLRQQLYRLRQELKRSGHPAYASAIRAQVRILGPHTSATDTTQRYTVLIEPQGQELHEALAAAGLEVPEVPDIDI